MLSRMGVLFYVQIKELFLQAQLVRLSMLNLRTLQKKGKMSRSSTNASGSKSSKSASKKRSDVPQLRQQAKQSIPPLKVLSENVPSLVQQQSLEEAKKWTTEWNMSVEDIMASQGERFPKAVVAPLVEKGPLIPVCNGL
jgi:hypothetical protein